MKERRRRIVLWVLIGVFCASAALLVWEITRYRKADRLNRELAGIVHGETPRTVEAEVRVQSPAPLEPVESEAVPDEPDGLSVLEQYAALYEKNADLAGWMIAEGIGVDLPVVYRADEQDYYLYRAFDGEELKSGTLFLGVPWEPDGNFAIVYGHNMRDDSMFGQLNRYADAAFGRENAIIRFDTLYEEREYELVGAFHGKAYPLSDKKQFHFYAYTNVSDESGFAEYVKNVKALSLYDTGVTPAYGDRLLVLCTCEDHASGRFVAVFRQK